MHMKSPMKAIIIPTLSLAAASLSSAALVAQWDFEEGSGSTTTEALSSTVSDSIGAGAGWSTATPGPASGYSLTTGGTNSTFGTNLNAATVGINGSGAKTIIGWFKTTSTADQAFFGWSPNNGIGAGTELRFKTNSSGFLRLEVTGGAALSSGHDSVLDGNWHMAAVIIEAADQIDQIQLYLDGNLVTTTGNTSALINTAGTGPGGATTPNELFIGSSGNTTSHWNGSIDEIRIYNTALSETELDGIYSAMAVPEPAAALLGGLGLLSLLRRRR